MDTIDSIEGLIDELNEADKRDVPRILEHLRLNTENLEKYASWCKGDYTRNCIIRTDTYELILLCWDSQSDTPIHDHGGQDCWVYQVAGELTEIRFAKNDKGDLEETKRMLLKPEGLTYMEDKMGYHQLCNKTNSRAFTLHLYASPIDECDVFNDEKQCFETKEMSYDTHDGALVGV